MFLQRGSTNHVFHDQEYERRPRLKKRRCPGSSAARSRILAAALMALLLPAGLTAIRAEEPSEGEPPALSGASVADDAVKARLELRGLEEAPGEPGHGVRAVENTLLWPPRTLVRGIMQSMSYGASTGGDSRVLRRLNEYLAYFDRRIGIQPVIKVSSGSRSGFGARVYFRDRPFGASVGAQFRDSENWAGKAGLTSSMVTGRMAWRLDVSGWINQRNDFEFHGFGADPADDPRNPYLPGRRGDAGTYSQRLTRIEWIVGARPLDDWEFIYTGHYQKRRIASPAGDVSGNIDRVFDASALPGITAGEETEGRQFYSEFAVRCDTRESRGQISPGIRVEGYAGLSTGVDEDRSRFIRSGMDAALYIPVIQHNRVIVPRLMIDTVDNLREDIPLSFAEYPRQLAFRGASGTTLLRNDEISMVPSLEYQWPLTHHVGGHLFIDYLLVSDRFADLSFAGAPYAWGFGFDVHSRESEMARFAISTGSEGLRVMISAGLGAHHNERTRWQ